MSRVAMSIISSPSASARSRATLPALSPWRTSQSVRGQRSRPPAGIAHSYPRTVRIDHLVVGSADLDRGIAWVADRLGVAPVYGGSHEGFGSRHALVGLGRGQYLEVLALDPGQASARGALAEQVATMDEPGLINLAVARSPLADAISMSRVRPDGVRLEWELSFTSTPLFFIDWKDSPHPSLDLPDAGRITSVTVTTPEPALLDGVEGVDVREGAWRVEASIDGVALA